MAMAQDSSSSSLLRALDTAIVTPSGPPLPPSCLPLTFLDLQWIHSPPVERIFFYRIASTRDATDHLISDLKRSLSTALRVYVPLAGHLRVTHGCTTAATRHDIVYEPGDGVAFTVAEYDGADLGDLASDHQPRPVSELARLVPRLHPAVGDYGAALLAVQATVLQPHGNLALGVTVHHAACDGVGSTGFLHTWEAACSGAVESLPPPPVIDRTLVVEPVEGLYEHYTRNLPSTDEIEFVKMSPDQLLATFTLSGEQLQRVKDAVDGEAARRGSQTPPRCSTLVAALGFVWSCYLRVKTETSDGAREPESPTYFIVPVDHRPWMKPPVPATYFGNCIGPAIGAATKRDLYSAGAGGLFTACSAGIARAVASPEWETMVERVKEVGARGVLSVAGSPRLRVYGVDFGFGPPAKVEIVSVARTGAMAVAEMRGQGGGVEVGMSLPLAGMAAFRSCFDDAVAWLASSHSTSYSC
uniref:Uncharacterized protein n=1 Tax=Avena sativa TaxID=4498 RepID=A0ACD5TVF7_AVESA